MSKKHQAVRKKVIPVRVLYFQGESGMFFANSPDDKGLLVGAKSMDELREKAPVLLNDLRKARGEDDAAFKITWRSVRQFL